MVGSFGHKTFDYLLSIGIINNEVEAMHVQIMLLRLGIYNLLLLCQPVWQVWSNALSLWEIQWVIPKSALELLLWCNSNNMNTDKKLIWEVIPMATTWTIWNTRNALIFEDTNPNWVEVTKAVKISAVLWIKSKVGGNNSTIENFLFRLKSLI